MSIAVEPLVGWVGGELETEAPMVEPAERAAEWQSARYSVRISGRVNSAPEVAAPEHVAEASD
jgi:hypothetical protein